MGTKPSDAGDSSADTVPSDSHADPKLTDVSKEDLMERARQLDDEADAMEIQPATPYMAEVSNTVEYGVFVNLTPSWGSDLSGLAHISRLPAMSRPRDYSEGDRMLVELVKRDGDTLGFAGLYSPDADANPLDVADINQTLTDLTDTVESVADRIEELETDDDPATDADAPAIVRTIPDAMRQLQTLHSEGYELEANATETREGGDVAELNLTVAKKDD